ncbi:hypothetical protein D3C71_1831570 [compost metagenome]
MPVEPVPITPTRLPAKLMGSCGQRAARSSWPWKRAMPGISGSLGTDSGPVAMMQ